MCRSHVSGYCESLIQDTTSTGITQCDYCESLIQDTTSTGISLVTTVSH